MKNIICLAVAVLVAGCSSPKATSKAPLKVLMIGNSFSASVLHETPKVADSLGLKVDFVNCNIGGCTLKTHWGNVEKASDPGFRPYLAMFGTPESETAKSVRAVCKEDRTNIPQLLSAVKWDVVTIQQGSVRSPFADTYQPYADNLIATIRKLAPQAEIVIQETWAYLPYHQKLAEWKMTQGEMYDRLHAAYGELARRTGFRVIPTGTAVQRYRAKLPQFRKLTKAEWDAIEQPNLPDLCGDPCGVPKWRKPYRWEKGFDPNKVRLMIDSTHLNPEGEYLQACVWIASLFGVDARQISYAPEGLSPDRAKLMRECAQAAIADWRLPVHLRVIAHRGLHGPGVAQNSLAAFKAAYAAGAKWIETDFHLLNNGRILCVHDRRELKKVSGENRVIAELTEADVESIDIGKTAGTVSPVHMPYLEDVLDIVPKDAIAQCEIKLYGSDYADKFDAARRSAGLSETNILVTSSNVDWLADFHRRYPRYQTGWLGCEVGEKDFDLQKSIARAREASCSFFCPGASSALRSGLTPDDADRVRAAGLDFRLFGVNTPELLTYAAQMRATAFTCDHWYKSFEWAKTMPYVRLLP